MENSFSRKYCTPGTECLSYTVDPENISGVQDMNRPENLIPPAAQNSEIPVKAGECALKDSCQAAIIAGLRERGCAERSARVEVGEAVYDERPLDPAKLSQNPGGVDDTPGYTPGPLGIKRGPFGDYTRAERRMNLED